MLLKLKYAAISLILWTVNKPCYNDSFVYMIGLNRMRHSFGPTFGGTLKAYPIPLWAIRFSTVTYIELWWSAKDLQRNELKIEGTRSTVDILTADKNLVFLKNLFSLLFNSPNNFEINRLIMLVVIRKFLLPYTASLKSSSSF